MSKEQKNNERAEELFSAITEIDDKYIEEADIDALDLETMTEEKVVTVRPGRKRWVAVAACLVILASVVIPLGSNLLSKDNVKYNDFTDSAETYDLGPQENDGAYVKAKSEAVDESAYEASDGAGSGKTNDSSVATSAEFNNFYKLDVTASNANVSNPELTAVVLECDFSVETPWVEVMWSNPTKEDKQVSPKFVIVRIGDYDAVESVVDDAKVTFESVLYTVPAGGEYKMTYKIDRKIYDISKAGHYRLYLDTAEVSEYNMHSNYFDFQLS